MQIGICTIQLGIPDTFSLKDKRNICSSLFIRVRKNFNVSIAETLKQDSYRESVITIVTVNTNKSHLYRTLSKVVEFIEQDKRVNIQNYTTEVL